MLHGYACPKKFCSVNSCSTQGNTYQTRQSSTGGKQVSLEDGQPLSTEDEKWRRAEESDSVKDEKNRRSSALPFQSAKLATSDS